MLRKSQLTEENKKLKRKLFIWENINISIDSSVKEKEIAAEKFLNEHPDYNLYEVSDTIKINRGTLYHHLYTRVEKPWYIEKEEMVSFETRKMRRNIQIVSLFYKTQYGIQRGIKYF